MLMRMIVLIRLVGLLGVTPVGLNANDFIKIGPGSYTAQRPEGCEPLPREIYKVKSLKGATPTNQWWSSVVWEKIRGQEIYNFFTYLVMDIF